MSNKRNVRNYILYLTKFYYFSTIVLLVLLLFSCDKTLATIESGDNPGNDDEAGIQLTNSNSKLTIKAKKDGTEYGVLQSPYIHWSKIKGDITREDNGDIILYITSIEFLTNWANGWTKGTSEATGIIHFAKNDTGYTTVVKEEFEFWDVVKGEIRYFDDYYLEDKGLSKVKNRMVRIKALSEFIKTTYELPDYFKEYRFNTKRGKSFRRTLRGILLSKETEYPEHLQELYAKGTIRRDFEEAAGLFYMYYNIDYYFNSMVHNGIFENLD